MWPETNFLLPPVLKRFCGSLKVPSLTSLIKRSGDVCSRLRATQFSQAGKAKQRPVETNLYCCSGYKLILNGRDELSKRVEVVTRTAAVKANQY